MTASRRAVRVALLAAAFAGGCQSPGPGMWWNWNRMSWCTCDGYGAEQVAYPAAGQAGPSAAVREAR